MALAIWPTSDPTAPAAPETKTTSPALKSATLSRPAVGGESGHAQRAEEGGRRGQVGARRRRCGGLQHGVFTPAQGVDDDVADLAVIGAGGDDFADGAAFHGFVELVRRRVGLGVVHASAHVRVNGEEEVPDQDLALLQLGKVGCRETEVRGNRAADRPGCELDLPRGGGKGGGFGDGAHTANSRILMSTVMLPRVALE